MQGLIRLMSSNGSYLGVGVRDIDAERKKALNLKEERGAEITSVEEGSPAAKADLKKGDVVLEYNGQRVEGMEQFIRMVRETPEGREVKIGVSRNGQLLTIAARPEGGRSRMERTVRIAPLPVGQIGGWVQSMDRPNAMLSWRSGTLGVEAESLDSQLADFFGVKSGVLVRSVTKGSPAEKAGIKAGDVIVKVEETKVSAPREVSGALRTAISSNRTVGLTVVREKREVPLKVTFEEPPARPATAPRTRSIQNRPEEH
jgi:serine protease Do